MSSKKNITDIDLNNNQLKNFVLENVNVNPVTTTEGRIVYNTASKDLQLFTGEFWEGFKNKTVQNMYITQLNQLSIIMSDGTEIVSPIITGGGEIATTEQLLFATDGTSSVIDKYGTEIGCKQGTFNSGQSYSMVDFQTTAIRVLCTEDTGYRLNCNYDASGWGTDNDESILYYCFTTPVYISRESDIIIRVSDGQVLDRPIHIMQATSSAYDDIFNGTKVATIPFTCPQTTTDISIMTDKVVPEEDVTWVDGYYYVVIPVHTGFGFKLAKLEIYSVIPQEVRYYGKNN